MKFVNQKAEIINYNSDDKISNIADIARICYKSENNKSRTNDTRLIKNLIKNKHFAMLEHEDFIFRITNLLQERFTERIAKIESFYGIKLYLIITDGIISGNIRAWRNFYKYCLLQSFLFDDKKPFPIPDIFNGNIFFIDLLDENSKNKELISEQETDKPYYYIELDDGLFKLIDKKELDNKRDILAHYRMSVKFICDRGISHEIVRHRGFSFAQESTRYVNYQNKPMQFISYNTSMDEQFQPDCTLESINVLSEFYYNRMIDNGWKPEIARATLAHNLKTEIVATGNIREWCHFLNLRLFGRTGKPHCLIYDLSLDLFNDIADKELFNNFFDNPKEFIVLCCNKMWENENE